MAEEATGKTVELLKRERTKAKLAFINHATCLGEEAGKMDKSELLKEYALFHAHAREVKYTNSNYKLGLLAELGGEEEDREERLGKQQLAKIKKTKEDCETKLTEVREIVQSNLWDRFGRVELLSAMVEAEVYCEHALGAPEAAACKDAYEQHVSNAKKSVLEFTTMYKEWGKLIPEEAKVIWEKKQESLKKQKVAIIIKKADQLGRPEKEGTGKEGTLRTKPAEQAPGLKIKATSLPKFDGSRRDFHTWKRTWESLQKQGEPTGSKEARRLQLLESVDGRICRDLSLSTCQTAEDMFRILENRFGNKATIAVEIIEGLEKFPILTSDQPRKVIDMIQAIEKALNDLIELDHAGAIKNLLVIRSIERKLPERIKMNWLAFMTNRANGVTPDNHIDSLLRYLKDQEEILERAEQLNTPLKPKRRSGEPRPNEPRRYASTKSTSKGGCVVCGEEGHGEKLFFCKAFKNLKPKDKLSAIERLGACKKCLGCHKDERDCSDTYLCRKQSCKRDHHFFLCQKGNAIPRPNTGRLELTERQQRFVSGLSPEAAEEWKSAFTNVSARSLCTDKSAAMGHGEGEELPVMLMLLEVTANAGQKIGTLIDLASDTNYITHSAAKRLNLRSEKVTLLVHGVGGMVLKERTKKYQLRVRIKTPTGTLRAHELTCYGLEEIAKISRTVKPEELKGFFPEASLEDLHRPEQVELLIGHREGRLAPQRVKVIGDLVLWDGPLGKTVGGTHPDLFEEESVAARTSKTHFARSMRATAVKYQELRASKEFKAETRSTVTDKEFLNWWKWDSIGAACEPKCGGCRCGNCQPGGKEMTLSEERELEVIRKGLTYVTTDDHVDQPHWDTKYPWIEDPISLPYNRSGVEATFLRTEKQLKKEPKWKVAYASQVHEMVERRAAKKLSKEMITNWRGPVWYVSHLVAPNPHSVTTPVRLVWNSSQKFKGLSMNDILLKGPDVLNPIRAVLLRFRRGVHAALGDIKKMYNSVWLEEPEMHLHRFLWRDTEESEIEEYAITRVNIGDRPAGCIAQLAMRETAKLPMFAHLKEECRILEEDSYVDDVLTSHNDVGKLDGYTKRVEEILKAGGFILKPWLRSGQSGREILTAGASSSNILILPNQRRGEDDKALGVGYIVESDKLYPMTSVNFSKRRKKMRVGQNLLEEEVRENTPKPLTRRQLLSQVAGLYDPIGLVTPAKQKGAILVRKAFQEAGTSRTQDTWDKPLSEKLREEAIQLFEEYVRLSQVTFHRSLTPRNWTRKP
ncbi:uncharacterized protein LOC144085517 [Stigmatopora argus]